MCSRSFAWGLISEINDERCLRTHIHTSARCSLISYSGTGYPVGPGYRQPFTERERIYSAVSLFNHTSLPSLYFDLLFRLRHFRTNMLLTQRNHPIPGREGNIFLCLHYKALACTISTVLCRQIYLDILASDERYQFIIPSKQY